MHNQFVFSYAIVSGYFANEEWAGCVTVTPHSNFSQLPSFFFLFSCLFDVSAVELVIIELHLTNLISYCLLIITQS